MGVDDRRAVLVFHALDGTTATVDVTHKVAGIILGSRDLDAHDGFE